MPFDFTETVLNGVWLIEPLSYHDSRGFFMETFHKKDFIAQGITEEFVQDNHSVSSKGVLRGLHFQSDPMAQGKLIRVLCGSVWDLVVDIRKNSPSFGKYLAFELSGSSNKMLYIPPGYAHGFLALEDNTHFLYKCTQEYSPAYERGIRWDDPDLNISWPITNNDLIISDKDRLLPSLRDLCI